MERKLSVRPSGVANCATLTVGLPFEKPLLSTTARLLFVVPKSRPMCLAKVILSGCAVCIIEGQARHSRDCRCFWILKFQILNFLLLQRLHQRASYFNLLVGAELAAL